MSTIAAPKAEPGYLRVEPFPQRIQVKLGTETIVDTTHAVVVFEGSLPPRYYVPRDEIHATLKEGPQLGHCPWKGEWRHVEVSAGGQTVADGGWSYVETTPACHTIQGHVAFYPQKMGSFAIG